ncbi:50S ribosome-binding GTPase [Candidatus Woesearchaeota archaeon]|nr:50S ribosome-binding GTPase [Candidatus Woesearchaeota archaeon]
MNFEKIPPVEQCSDILDTAFRKARVKGKQKKLAGNWLQIIRKKESLKLDIVKDTIDNSLQKILTSFPDLNGFPQFYLKLMALTLDLAELKKALGSIKWVQQKNRELHRKFISLINRETKREIIKNINKQYYGRISSLLKQISHQLRYLETCRKVMRSYPDIKEMFTVCIYGFPNVGKTTLLNKLTQTKAKVAAYPFTTKSINAGYLTVNGTQIQVLDVPGTLAREKLNPIERQAELVLKELADLIIYVYDLTESCGYSVEQQQKLQQKLAGREVIIYASKEDLLTESEIRKLKNKLYSIEQIKAEIAKRL